MKDLRARSRAWLFGPFAAVGPILIERLVEALELAVPARRVGRGEYVPGAELGQQRLEAGLVWALWLLVITASSGRQPCSRIQAAARRKVAVTAVSDPCSSE
jgi:hypothetical protein